MASVGQQLRKRRIPASLAFDERNLIPPQQNSDILDTCLLYTSASRGDQILNARSFEAQGFSMVIDEDYLSPGLLIEKVHALYCLSLIHI